MLLSLLRSPTSPNPEADQGKIPFTYALCPHVGTLAESDTVRTAYALNNPCTALRATGNDNELPTRSSAVSCDAPNVSCETVKHAENGNGTILRMYECKNTKQKVTVTLGFSAEHVWACDLMENKLFELPLANGSFSYDFKGFEIATFLAN